MTISKASKAKWYGTVFLLAFIVYFPGTNRPLRDAEAKYAEIPREMLVLGDWLTPHLDYASYYDKPPLTFWATALFYQAFEVSERAARLANVCWAFLAAFLTGILAQRMFGSGHGYLASGLFLSTVGVFVYCLDAGIEFGLISFMVLAFIFFWDFYEKDSLASLCLFYLSLALGFLAKGLPGVVIPGGAAFMFLLFRRKQMRLVRLFHPLGVFVFLTTAAPWTIIMMKKHPDFFKVFIVDQHLHRFTGTMASNDALFSTPLWLALVMGEFFPWVVHLPQTTVSLARMMRRRAIVPDKIILLLIWAAIPLSLYSLSRSKVDFYGLESYPPMIILLSIAITDLLGSKEFSSPRSWGWPWVSVALLALVSMLALFCAKDMRVVEELGIPSLKVAHVFLLAAFCLGILVWLCFIKGRMKLAFFGISLLSVILFYSTIAMFRAAFSYDSMKFAADTFNKEAEPTALLMSDERPEFEHVAVLNFYTKRRAFLLRNREGSILHFIEKDREAMCLDERDLVRLGRRHSIYLVGETEKTRRRLSQLKLQFSIVSSAGNRSLFRLESAGAEAGKRI